MYINCRELHAGLNDNSRTSGPTNLLFAGIKLCRGKAKISGLGYFADGIVHTPEQFFHQEEIPTL